MITKEWYPQAYVMGVSWGEFWHMNPRIISAIADGYNQRLQQVDYMNWLNGSYMLSAVTVGVERNLAGRKARGEYIKEPILSRAQKDAQPLTEDTLQKQRELFVEKLKTMQANFELSHRKKNMEGGEK